MTTVAERLHAQFLRAQYLEIEQFLSTYHGHVPVRHHFHGLNISRQISTNGTWALEQLPPVNLIAGLIASALPPLHIFANGK